MLPSLLFVSSPREAAPNRAQEWLADLDIAAVAGAMGGGDPAREEAARAVLLGHHSVCREDILFRQEILADALAARGGLAGMSAALAADLAAYEEAYRRSQPGYARFTPLVERIRTAAGLMDILLSAAERVRGHLLRVQPSLSSRGMTRYAAAFAAFFDDPFLREARAKQRELADISDGSRVEVGARLGVGLKGTDYRIRGIRPARRTRLKAREGGVIPIASDGLQLKAIELRDAVLLGVLYAANAVCAQTAGALKELHRAVQFYLGAVHLKERLDEIGVATCTPTPEAPGGAVALGFHGLTDVSLALRMGTSPVPNSLDLSGARLCAITGANQGGKSTFLRSVGLAQVMMQSGLFVAAQSFASGATTRVLTHFCREEDGAMDSGKLDEELRRMSRIVEEIEPQAMLLMNESFASTTEREGSAIAQEITLALRAMNARILFVTHLYDYAKAIETMNLPDARLLRAERAEDGSRSFKMREGIALPTSYGLDLYRAIVGAG